MEVLTSNSNTIELRNRMRELEAENVLLRADNRRLRKKLGAAAWRIDGRRGEEFVAELVGGELTTGSAQYDLMSTKGVTFEIKCPNLNEAVAGEITNRWSWSHVLGSNRRKKFDRLLLLGPTDHRYRTNYADPESPFVMFDIPFAEVQSLLGRGDLIQISTAPLEVRKGRLSPKRQILFARYQVTRKQLTERYGSL
jgi:hypothetical protein